MIRIALAAETDIAGWRDAARRLLRAQIAPANVDWQVGRDSLFDHAGDDRSSVGGRANDIPPPRGPQPVISKELLRQIETALLHSDPERFALGYRIVYRAQSEPRIFQNPADPDMHRLRGLSKSIRRDIHKMHAFVRFRKIGSDENGRESFVAWFEPEHHITLAVAPFFRNRFTGMNWLIVTPEASIAWDGQTLATGPGGAKSDVPQEDAVEAEWKAYYGAIFNPARLKTKAMLAEMPAKYWKNLPEAALIPGLTREAETRMNAMIDKEQTAAIAIKDVMAPAQAQDFTDLDSLYKALSAATDYPQKDFSPTLVPGEGPDDASMMFVGEQPGDQEDQAGQPFVGPAGQLLDRALAAASVNRDRAYVTNAVKRFKFVQRGKRRIHSKPSNQDVEYYRWWLEQERQIVQPQVIVALGATAVRALTGKSLTISRNRSQLIDYRDGVKLLITVHPSYLLRLPDGAGQKVEYEKFLRDLAMAQSALAA